MSMDLGGAKGGVKSDINVTPLVDVMLVLLIIMMVITPMLQQGISVRLPVASNTAVPSSRNRFSSASRGASPCTSTGNGGSGKRACSARTPSAKPR